MADSKKKAAVARTAFARFGDAIAIFIVSVAVYHLIFGSSSRTSQIVTVAPTSSFFSTPQRPATTASSRVVHPELARPDSTQQNTAKTNFGYGGSLFGMPVQNQPEPVELIANPEEPTNTGTKQAEAAETNTDAQHCDLHDPMAHNEPEIPKYRPPIEPIIMQAESTEADVNGWLKGANSDSAAINKQSVLNWLSEHLLSNPASGDTPVAVGEKQEVPLQQTEISAEALKTQKEATNNYIVSESTGPESAVFSPESVLLQASMVEPQKISIKASRDNNVVYEDTEQVSRNLIKQSKSALDWISSNLLIKDVNHSEDKIQATEQKVREDRQNAEWPDFVSRISDYFESHIIDEPHDYSFQPGEVGVYLGKLWNYVAENIMYDPKITNSPGGPPTDAAQTRESAPNPENLAGKVGAQAINSKDSAEHGEIIRNFVGKGGLKAKAALNWLADTFLVQEEDSQSRLKGSQAPIISHEFSNSQHGKSGADTDISDVIAWMKSHLSDSKSITMAQKNAKLALQNLLNFLSTRVLAEGAVKLEQPDRDELNNYGTDFVRFFQAGEGDQAMQISNMFSETFPFENIHFGIAKSFVTDLFGIIKTQIMVDDKSQPLEFAGPIKPTSIKGFDNQVGEWFKSIIPTSFDFSEIKSAAFEQNFRATLSKFSHYLDTQVLASSPTLRFRTGEDFKNAVIAFWSDHNVERDSQVLMSKLFAQVLVDGGKDDHFGVYEPLTQFKIQGAVASVGKYFMGGKTASFDGIKVERSILNTGLAEENNGHIQIVKENLASTDGFEFLNTLQVYLTDLSVLFYMAAKNVMVDENQYYQKISKINLKKSETADEKFEAIKLKIDTTKGNSISAEPLAVLKSLQEIATDWSALFFKAAQEIMVKEVQDSKETLKTSLEPIQFPNSFFSIRGLLDFVLVK